MNTRLHLLPLLVASLFLGFCGCLISQKGDTAPASVRALLMNNDQIFGQKEKDTPDNPAVVEEPELSMIRGTRSSLIIAWGAAEEHKPVLYVEPRRNTGVKKEEIQTALNAALKDLQSQWPGIRAEPFETGFRVVLPAK